MLVQDRDQARQVFLDAWAKRQAGAALEPLEAVVAGVIEAHPEYHGVLARPQAAIEADFEPAGGRENPFLHMGMHIAIHEQLATDRPPGIRALYRMAQARMPDTHALEHRLMECLGDVLWQARRTGRPPDERAYLECVRRLGGEDRWP